MGCAETAECKIPKEWNEQFFALKLSYPNVREIHYVFREIDNSRSGYINFHQLCMFLDIEETLFAKRLFNTFEKCESNCLGKIDFREFLLSLWDFLTLNKASLGKCLLSYCCKNPHDLIDIMPFITEQFLFDLYDDQKLGVLTHQQVVTMLTDLYGWKKMEIDPLARS